MTPPVLRDKIVITSDRTDSQVQQLSAAFARLGMDATFLRLADIAFDSRHVSGIAIPGFDGALPAAVVVRSISSGSFEAVTRRLGVLHALGHLGIPVWNSAKAIERCVDKSTTTFLMARAGLPVPETFAVESIANARAIAERELPNGPLVLKPLFGSQGRGVRLIETVEQLPEGLEVDDVYYLQRYVARPGTTFCDYRVFTCNGTVLGMIARHADGWVTNIARGARAEPVTGPLRPALETLALSASAAIGTDFSGIDIIPAADGRLQLLEVNSMPAWTGLQSVIPVKVADSIAEALVSQIAPVEGERPAA